MEPILIAIIIVALIFNFLNGIHDSSNIVATMISSRAFSPRAALGVTAVAEFAGPFLFGVAVAQTIGRDIVNTDAVSMPVIMAALIGGILWNLLTWYLGIPSSSSHALIGGIIGAAVMAAGWGAVQWQGMQKILIALFTSPIIGFIFGFFFLRLILLLAWNATPRINIFFKSAQLVTATALALSHGANDAQKTMGIITLALITAGLQNNFTIPAWVIISCAATMSLGTATGGWRLIRTLGAKFYKVKPVDGFASQLASAAVILGASVLGGPVSTTQVVSSAIMGVGAGERANKVRWGVARDIALAWFLTIPSTALVSAGIYWLLIGLM